MGKLHDQQHGPLTVFTCGMLAATAYQSGKGLRSGSEEKQNKQICQSRIKIIPILAVDNPILMPSEKVINFAFDLIRATVPDHYCYHHVEHTKDVFDAVRRIATSEGISAQEEEIVLLAALFHDTGFVKGKEEHEERSCQITMQHLPTLGYPSVVIEQVCSIILVTKVPQRPVNLLQEIICDADLDYLGRDDYALWGDRLYRELRWEDPQLNDEAWRQTQIDFLKQHHYFTKTNSRERENKKQHNLQLLIHGAYDRNDE